MADEVQAVSEVSSSSSSSSSHETHESHETTSTQSTSETSSSSSSSSTNKTEETHEINTSDSTSISHDASEADEADDGSSVNMNWLSKDEAIEQAGKLNEKAGKADNDNSVNMNWLSKDEAIEQSARLQEAREPIQEANETVKQILIDYERSFMNDTTYDIEDLSKLDKYSKDNNCANFQTSISDDVGTFDKAEYNKASGCSPDDLCKTFGKDLGIQGYERVEDISEVKAGDFMVKVKSNGKGHTELITGLNGDGTASMIGSNNNGDDIQEITEHDAALELSKNKDTDVGVNVYHKDFSVEELDKVAESLDTNAVAANSAERLGKIEEKLADDSLSKEDRETLETQKQALESLISDIDKFSGELETIHNILDGKNSESVEQAGDMSISEQNFATASVEQKSETSNPVSSNRVPAEQEMVSQPTTETNESETSMKDTILNKISEVSGSAMESIKGLVDKIFG